MAGKNKVGFSPTKLRFVDRIQFVSGCTQKEAIDTYNRFLAVLISEVEQGHEVKFTHFGKFYTRQIAPCMRRNPRTNEIIMAKGFTRLVFRPTPAMKRRIRGEEK